MNRRELLRLLSIATTTLAAPVTIDWERLRFASMTGRIDAASFAQQETVNRLLWQDYGAAETKAVVFGAAREQLSALIEGLRDARSSELRRRQQELIADVLQLSGEILLDANHLTEAAHCYALSGTFAAEARAYDLWACALTRHAYLGIFDTRYRDALPLAEQAARIARRGDSTLPTRYWVESVRAQVLAGLDNATECERAFDAARGVDNISATASVGWLRFNGARIDEEHASCLVRLARPEPAEQILTPLLDRPLSTRRRASVLVDLAAAGALQNDPVQAVWYGGTAVDIARRTKSGYLSRRLGQLRQHLTALDGDRHITHLTQQISTLAASPT
ncbi:transcriptional regulator [Nocardia blacklockiae]|uniref:transcriptional regulator n=1 Tax=Nocardia blacklockiae TaxID=480036 RepID=UPI00189609AA|nr:transcriptional regulator [Nocardia blacklockiae]MBF6175254.1 transcriptional regulator [Nocardia blacklockiae]